MTYPSSRRATGLFMAALFVGGGWACAPNDADEASEPTESDLALMEAARSIFGVLEPVPAGAVDAPDVALGRALFWDERVSLDGRTSCASCHTRDDWGSDARRLSLDARGQLTSRHSQTVFNSTRQPALRWRGDRASAAEQAHGSITGSMGFADALEPVSLLTDLGYAAAFEAAFPDDPEPLSPENYGLALEAYQATLVTPAPFDAFLSGDATALTEEQKDGLQLFISSGCVACHSGELLGGTAMQRFGIVQDYWTATGSEHVDQGRYAITGEESDRYVFRTPMLRNVAKTAPYFHDGSVESLHEAVRIMASVQLGRALPDDEVDRIVAFLESLTGEVPVHYAPPE